MIRIALIDDHPTLTNAIGAWLCNTGRFIIAGTAATLEEGRKLLERLNPLPEIIILDVSLGTEDGLALIPYMKDICALKKIPLPAFLVFSMHEDSFLIQRAMDLGAKAYIAKSAESSEFIAAIDTILAGKTCITPQKNRKHQPAYPSLTRRENEIAALVKQSLTARQIAKRLFISVRTVETHLAHIYVKTNTASWEELHNL
jgi:NarL family two-component system response regulator LiaR